MNLPEMEVGEIEHVAEPHPIEDVAEGAAKHEREGDGVVAPLLAPKPEGDEGGDRGGESDQEPALGLAVGGQKAHRDARILQPFQLEEGQDLDRLPLLELE